MKSQYRKRLSPTGLLLLAMLLSAGCGERPQPEEHQQPAGSEVAVCAAHQLPKTECFICDPQLRDPERLWCREHDRYEDRCFICHPELKDPERLWCREHNLYEDECFFCHPELKETTAVPAAPENREPAAAFTAKDGLYCNEHRVYENECGICHPELAGSLQVGQGLKIRFESPESARKAGIGIIRPVEGGGVAAITVPGQLSYNRNRLARITPLASGVVERVLVDLGDPVRKGQTLLETRSPEIAAAKSAYLTALATEALKAAVFKRKQELLDEKIAAQQSYDQARAEYELAKTHRETARQQLLNFGIGDSELAEIVRTRSASAILPVAAPFSGTVIDRRAVIGEVVETGDLLFSVAELSTMWLELSIPEDRIAGVAVGDPLEARFAALPGKVVEGLISWLADGLDRQTRMIKARAVVANPGKRLKDGFFGEVRIAGKQGGGLLVPAASLHHFEQQPFVFARVADDLYEVRRVAVAGSDGRTAEIVAGLSADDQVVAARSFTVKSEFLKARLGAGCVDH